MSAKIHIGTSGFSYPDWRGDFYPKGLPQNKMLDFYMTTFDTVEINSTYYAIPRPQVFKNMVRKSDKDFQFLVKAHESATHRRAAIVDETPKYLEAIKPLVESGKLAGVLLQFPWSFRNTQSNVEHLVRCRELFGDLPLFVEFRHASWMKDEVFALLKQLSLGFVSVDEPQLTDMVPPIAKATGDVGYIRFHGRNAEKWYGTNNHERYDYLYPIEELEEWVPKVDELKNVTKSIFIMFNNCRRAQAAYNALVFMKFYGISPKRAGHFTGDLLE